MQYLGELENNIKLPNQFQEIFASLPVTSIIIFTGPMKLKRETVRPGSTEDTIVEHSPDPQMVRMIKEVPH